MENINIQIERLVKYAVDYLDLKETDIIYVRNKLLSKFSIEYQEVQNVEEVKSLELIINPLLEYAKLNNLLTNEDIFITEVLDIVSLTPSFIADKSLKVKNKRKFTKWFYEYCKSVDYIKWSAILKNKKWTSKNTRIPLDITINLSKPEKSNADIAKAKTVTTINYPKCLLCKENLGFKGNDNWPARSTIRTIPLILNNEKWFWQYSPYSYYNEHCIIISDEHRPMKLTKDTYRVLLDFLEQYPFYFIGGNAPLAIVGGSILAHDHFQGGGYKLPLHKAQIKEVILDNNNLKVAIVDWYNSVIRLSSNNKETLINTCEAIYQKWIAYSQGEIINETNGVPHNTLNPIARKEKDIYIIDLILRNNRTNKEHPEGIFHAHKEYHNIKSESIGLIEAQGLFILPPRLDRQIKIIKKILQGQKIELSGDMLIHQDFINKLLNKYGTLTSNAEQIIRQEINLVCENILKNTAVFKEEKEFIKFVKSCFY
ncbi:MAG: UDP-glucose--hexose-1-phosphate uridylyltransferase [Bacillales bacterium]|jgi:UDPglucose--hexose-1-phosphate uridylyltransferase|nr:UDP-glucose--hexose-1-phosphate uridylyltransferase [Bacillales bacterium]